MDDGVYPPQGVTRRVTRERVLLAGGPRALLLQLAHPLVAAGVAQHSAFPAAAVARLRRTLDSTLAIVFGDTRQAHAAAARVNAVHARVHGVLDEPVGRFPAGTPYSASDPGLLLWVHATLVDTTLRVYPLLVGPLSRAEQEALWQESKIAARMLGTPDSVLPESLEAFEGYVEGMLASGDLAIGESQRRMARDVLYPPISMVPRPAFALPAALTISLLPEPVRRGYGLSAEGVAGRIAGAAPGVIRRVVPWLPARLRVMSYARAARRRRCSRTAA